MAWPWKRDRTSDRDVDVLRAQADAAAPAKPSEPAATVEPAEPAEPASSGLFRMVIEDVFNIKGRGTVATGRIDAGWVRVGQQVRIVRAGTVLSTTTVTGVEMFRKVLEVAGVGDNVGLLLAGVTGDNVMRDDVLES